MGVSEGTIFERKLFEAKLNFQRGGCGVPNQLTPSILSHL